MSTPADNPQNAPAAPETPGPSSPKVVSKTPLKTPREIVLEKRVATLEDRLTGVESAHSDVLGWLEKLLPGGKAPAKPAAPAAPSAPAAPAPAAPARRTLTQEVNHVLGWED